MRRKVVEAAASLTCIATRDTTATYGHENAEGMNISGSATLLSAVGLGTIPERVDEALGLWGQGRIVTVAGPPGCGRKTFIRSVVCADSDVREVWTPPLSLDAPAHLFHQLLRVAGDARVTAASRDAGQSITQRLKPVLRRISDSSRKVLIALGPGWSPERHHFGESAGDDELDHARQRAGELLRAIVDSKVRVMFVLEGDHRGFPGKRVTLEPARAPIAFLGNHERWGAFADDAGHLNASLGSHTPWMNPIALRVGVCAVALGRAYGHPELGARKVARRLHTSETLSAADELVVDLARLVPQFGAAVLRLSRARFDIPRGWLDDLLPAASLGAAREVATTCLTYGDDDARVTLPLRRAATQIRRGAEGDSHCRAGHEVLARHHRDRDGAKTWDQAVDTGFDWLEGIHHALRANDAVADSVRGIDLGYRELYWSLGRSLSRRGKSLEAAEVFRGCLDRIDSDDNYAHHYLAFNLDRAGREPEAVERHFRKALKGNPDNAWWNGRFVSWLIGHGRPAEAQRAWAEGLRRLDPTGQRVLGGDFLAWNYHRWVCIAALEMGHRALAREVLDALPDRLFNSEPEFQALRQRLQIAEFIDRYGHAIHPETVPPDRYWERPAGLPDSNEKGERLAHWYPGRVLSVSAVGLEVVLGDPEAGRAGEPRILGLHLREPPDVAGHSTLTAGQFVHAMRSVEGRWLFFPVLGNSLTPEVIDAGRLIVRYLLQA